MLDLIYSLTSYIFSTFCIMLKRMVNCIHYKTKEKWLTKLPETVLVIQSSAWGYNLP